MYGCVDRIFAFAGEHAHAQDIEPFGDMGLAAAQLDMQYVETPGFVISTDDLDAIAEFVSHCKQYAVIRAAAFSELIIIDKSAADTFVLCVFRETNYFRFLLNEEFRNGLI